MPPLRAGSRTPQPSAASAGRIVTAAAKYDAWYDTAKGRALFASELACISPEVSTSPRPLLEVGAGTGRFSAALSATLGIDLSRPRLVIAARRGVPVAIGAAEQLPVRSASIGTVLMAFSLCFIASPELALSECRRALRPGGALVLALLLGGTPWADWYAERAAAGDPSYAGARFHSWAEVEALLAAGGFAVRQTSSTLYQPPRTERYRAERPRAGFTSDAGVVVVRAARE